MAGGRFVFEVTVKEDERGFLYRDGAFQRLLGPGRHRFVQFRSRYTCDVVKVVRQEVAAPTAQMFSQSHPALAAENFATVQCGPTEVAIVTLDGDPRHFVMPNTTRAFWTVLTRVEIDKIETATQLRIAKRDLDRVTVTNNGAAVLAVVEAHEAGLLFVDGELRERLPPGRHAFWQVARVVRVAKVDLRPTPLEISAQEILTKDRIGVRVTLTAFVRITDPEKATLSAPDVPNALYRLIQFAIREAVAARSLDEILAARDELDREVRAFVEGRARELGAEVGDVGVKDIILPGDVRALLNKVVEAERVAKANTIRRQEETASTRSLLNTARLMENNPLLHRLKELEALEKLVEKVGRIDLHAGQEGVGALLTKLYRLEPGERPAGEPDV